eukprot:TRINITY_DN1767_c0_g2_i1.p1 TRINITY_DN1767_c0_g2~~TRINITY_DN1767_c0_g2_i1.p1  ORF type:complete len:445 (-),score=82.69 TRINITY_DN1767_c0_g2_i1:181-1371(-)
MGVDNKTAEFLKKNPHGKVPVLETDHGCVWESNAIARYVARLADKGLFGKTHLDAALVEQWIDFSTNEIDAPLMSWIFPLMGFWPYDKKKEDAAKEALKRSLEALNTYLMDKTFLVGDKITLADIILTCNMYHGYTKVFASDFRKAFPNVERYFLTCINQPQFKTVMGDVALCTEPLKYTPKKEEKKKEKKPAEPKPEAAKDTAQPETDKPADDKPKEEKPNAWMDLLPATTMVMDAWKRLYSNAPIKNFREVAINGLWNGGPVPNSLNNEVFTGFDPVGYSFWFCHYKYNDENTVNFMVMNKVGGFLQRIDYARKYAFGVVAILQKDGIFPIEGVFMFRGQEIPPPIVENCYDIELYDWEKVDLSNEDQKKRLEDIICEEDLIDGMTLIEGKVFK